MYVYLKLAHSELIGNCPILGILDITWKSSHGSRPYIPNIAIKYHHYCPHLVDHIPFMVGWCEKWGHQSWPMWIDGFRSWGEPWARARDTNQQFSKDVGISATWQKNTNSDSFLKNLLLHLYNRKTYVYMENQWFLIYVENLHIYIYNHFFLNRKTLGSPCCLISASWKTTTCHNDNDMCFIAWAPSLAPSKAYQHKLANTKNHQSRLELLVDIFFTISWCTCITIVYIYCFNHSVYIYICVRVCLFIDLHLIATILSHTWDPWTIKRIKQVKMLQ